MNTARVAVREDTSYDNWNGGTYGHDVIVYLPNETMAKISIAEQKTFEDKIKIDLNGCASHIDNEFVRNVVIELIDETDPLFQNSSIVALQNQIDPDTLSFWQPGYIRLFISHRDSKKVAAKALADALKPFGISAFVAHDTIEPMSTWQREIEKGLETMEIMLAFLTNDFHESTWTNQEIGYALGRNVPIVSLKLETTDPRGFIGIRQALKGRLDQPTGSVKEIYDILCEKLGEKSRLQRSLISAFAESPDWSEARTRFDRMEQAITALTDTEFRIIKEAFFRNSQLHGSTYLTNRYQRLQTFLQKCTGKQVEVIDRKISNKDVLVDDDIPF